MRVLRGFQPDGTYDITVDFTIDDDVNAALILLADRMCDAVESQVLPVLGGGATQVDMAFVRGLGDVAGWYVPGTHRLPAIVMNAPVIQGSDDPVAVIATVLSGAAASAWRESRHGRADADDEAHATSDAYRILIDTAAPWRGTSMPDVT